MFNQYHMQFHWFTRMVLLFQCSKFHETLQAPWFHPACSSSLPRWQRWSTVVATHAQIWTRKKYSNLLKYCHSHKHIAMIILTQIYFPISRAILRSLSDSRTYFLLSWRYWMQCTSYLCWPCFSELTTLNIARFPFMKDTWKVPAKIYEWRLCMNHFSKIWQCFPSTRP